MVYLRTKDGQDRHDRIVASQAQSFVNNGWSTVYADLPGLAKPPTIGGYIPDVYARHGDYERVVEVETPDSVDTAHTKEQLAAFQAWVDQAPNSRKLSIVLA